MKNLYDSRGNHIANFHNNQLHSPNGANVGHYLEKENIFIDMQGYYLGEIVSGNRLLRNQYSPNRNICYGSYGNSGNIGNSGNAGNCGSIGSLSGFEDVLIKE